MKSAWPAGQDWPVEQLGSHFVLAAPLPATIDGAALARLASRLAVAGACGGRGGGGLRDRPSGFAAKLGLAEPSNTAAGEA